MAKTTRRSEQQHPEKPEDTEHSDDTIIALAGFCVPALMSLAWADYHSLSYFLTFSTILCGSIIRTLVLLRDKTLQERHMGADETSKRLGQQAVCWSTFSFGLVSGYACRAIVLGILDL